MRNYPCQYTGVPYNNVYVWNRPNVKAPMPAVYLYQSFNFITLIDYSLDIFQPQR